MVGMPQFLRSSADGIASIELKDITSYVMSHSSSSLRQEANPGDSVGSFLWTLTVKRTHATVSSCHDTYPQHSVPFFMKKMNCYGFDLTPPWPVYLLMLLLWSLNTLDYPGIHGKYVDSCHHLFLPQSLIPNQSQCSPTTFYNSLGPTAFSHCCPSPTLSFSPPVWPQCLLVLP